MTNDELTTEWMEILKSMRATMMASLGFWERSPWWLKVNELLERHESK